MRQIGCKTAHRATAVPLRSRRLRVQCAASPEPDAERPSSSKGKNFSGERRRRGRPAHLRSPDDSPLRDGNRDRIMGLLTERAAKTLAYYLLETNHNIHHWVNRFIKDNPIPREGNWDDVSGDTFLRTLLAMPIEEATPWGRDPVFHNTSGSDVDPRSIAQRIMEIRSQLALEFIQDLQQVAEENKLLQLETLQASLLSTEDAIADGTAAARQVATATSPLPASQRSRGSDAEAEAAKARQKKAKKSVLPPQPTPPNWRLRLEVEAQVYGDADGDAAAAPGAAAASGIPDSIQTGIISPGWTGPTAAAQPPPPPTAAEPADAAEPQAPPPLHPEVAELLPLIRASPSALTPDVAQVLSSLAVMSDGKLHPDIVDALRAAVTAGAKLHPEMAELLKMDAPPSPPPPAAAAAAAPAAPASATPVAGAGGAAGKGGSVQASASVPSVGSMGTAGAATAAAAAAAAAAAVEVQRKPEPEPEEENSITAMQNDTCLHSDDE